MYQVLGEILTERVTQMILVIETGHSCFHKLRR